MSQLPKETVGKSRTKKYGIIVYLYMSKRSKNKPGSGTKTGANGVTRKI